MSSGKSPAKSPAKQPASRGSAERKDSLGAIGGRNVDDDNDGYDDVGGGDDYMDNNADDADDADDAMSSASKARRVSFGDDTKSAQDGAKRARGRPPSKPKTPDSGGGNSSARTTPDSARSARTELSTPGSDDFPRGRKVQDDTFRDSDEEETEAVDRTDVQDTDSDNGTWNASAYVPWFASSLCALGVCH